jgi:PTH1 family peptidyl-tRNA hydrolase
MESKIQNPKSKIKMAVGLGNPGKTYASTRHNIGSRVIDALQEEKWDGLDLYKPTGFMNTCGGPVTQAARERGYGPQDIVVVCDDFAIPLGNLRLRLKGSSGGHNGLDSILQMFDTQDVPRLRIGIGPVPAEEDPARFVLMAFKKDEKELVAKMIERAAEALKVIASEGFEAAMNRFNTKVKA